MNTSSKFIVAMHVVTALAGKKVYYEPGTTTSSEQLAESVNTNPVVIRRILSSLSKAGLVETKSGPKGGAVLAKDPKKITLDEIYNAVEEENILFHLHYSEPNCHCAIGANIQPVLLEKLKPLDNMVSNFLSEISLSEVMNDVLTKSGILKYVKMGKTPQQIECMVKSGEIPVKNK